MNIIKNVNTLLAFLLELCALFILGYWGFTLQTGKVIRIIFGLLAPLVMAIVWSIWCAPSSTYRLEGVWLVLVKCLLFGIVICCLLNMKYGTQAMIFGIFVVINLGISILLGTI